MRVDDADGFHADLESLRDRLMGNAASRFDDAASLLPAPSGQVATLDGLVWAKTSTATSTATSTFEAT